MSSFKTIALFGANGQVGKAVFNALIKCHEPRFHVVAFTSPNSSFNLLDYGDVNVSVERVDLNHITSDDLAAVLSKSKVDVAISALGGTIIARQGLIQDAAAKAGVKRFYPSEFGMHSVVWLPGEQAYIHPVRIHPQLECDLKPNHAQTWATKIKNYEDAIRHPAIKSGQMSYTVIGCADCFDATGEPLFCPWLDQDSSVTGNGYTIHVVGNPDAKMDYSSLTDVANYLVASLRHPKRSENKYLGFRSDHLSFQEVADLLRRHSRRPVKLDVISVEQMQGILKDASSAPEKWRGRSTFPVDFFVILRYVQGQGCFWRPPGLLHNELFPEVKPVTVDEYFGGLFSK